MPSYSLRALVLRKTKLGETDVILTLLATGNTPRMSEIGTDSDWSGGLLTSCLPYIDVMSEHVENYLGAPVQLPGTGRPGPWARRGVGSAPRPSCRAPPSTRRDR